MSIATAAELKQNEYPSYDVFGYKITPMTADEQIDLITRRIEGRQGCVITYLNLHALHVLEYTPAMVAMHRAQSTHVVIDGMPIVALCRFAGVPVTRRHRVTNLDLIWPLLDLAATKKWRVYYIGSTQEIVERALATVRAQIPGIEIQGHHGFVDLDCPDIIADITAFEAHLVLVGMGVGLQERWIHLNADRISPAFVLSVGALFEYIAGAVKTPPRWMGRYGLEWLFRLAENPRRFWKRYLIEPWSVAWALCTKLTQRFAKS